MNDDVIALVPLLFGVILIPAVSVPVTRMAAAGRLERNGAAGIRTRHTGASDAAWVAGHAAALPRVSRSVPVAAVTAVVAVVATMVGGEGWGIAAGMLGLVVEMIVLVSATGPANAAVRAAEDFHAR